MDMGERIKELRKAKGYTQQDLARKLGLKDSAIAKYENGRVENIKRNVIAQMAEILDCSPTYLMGFDSGEQTNTDFVVSDDEKQLIIDYRNSDGETRSMIDRLLVYSNALNKNNES